VPIDRDRERAKRRYARRQAKLQARAARARRTQQVVGAVVAVLLVAGGVFLLTRLTGDNAGTTPAAASTASASAAASGTPSAPTTPTSTKSVQSFPSPPPRSLAGGATWTAKLATSAGDITLSLDGAKAPQTVSSFVFLSRKNFYDDTSCHRLTTQGIYVLQCGDPTGTGSGGPGYQYGIENAPADGHYPAGTVAMARANDPNSNGSQFFLVYKDSTLPTDGGGYTVFGKVTKGLDVLQQIAQRGTADGGGDGAPKQPVTITSIRVAKQ
jgi:peptidyl-prolyl cis-trans isomerase B (cyclophilin B)